MIAEPDVNLDAARLRRLHGIGRRLSADPDGSVLHVARKSATAACGR
jgi:hypothetical protein